MDSNMDLEQFLKAERKTFSCNTCAQGPIVNNEVDKWLALCAAGKLKPSATALVRFLRAHRGYPYKKDALLRHLNECRPAEYEKAKHGSR